MTLEQATEIIEGPEFSALVNVASSFRTFSRILAENDAVSEIRAQTGQPGLAEKLAFRILHLVKLPAEDGLEHAFDAAIAAYLWILAQHNLDNAVIAAEAIRSKRKAFWWARQIADMLVPSQQPAPLSVIQYPESTARIQFTGSKTVPVSIIGDSPVLLLEAHRGEVNFIRVNGAGPAKPCPC